LLGYDEKTGTKLGVSSFTTAMPESMPGNVRPYPSAGSRIKRKKKMSSFERVN
jgi:hypothetical protein